MPLQIEERFWPLEPGCPGGRPVSAPSQVLGNGSDGAGELDFGLLSLADGAGPSWLCLQGLEPHQLTALSLLDGRVVHYSRDSRVDGSGRTTSAGELLLTMARMEGWTALVVDVRGLQGIGAFTRVRCRVAQLSLHQARNCRLQISCT